MTRTLLVAWHVFKESVRDRVLFVILGFAVMLVVASVLIGEITAGQDVKVIKDLGLATLEACGVLIAVFVGVGLVAREIERRSIYSLLAKPVHRWEFVLGKYVGLVAAIAVNVPGITVALVVGLAGVMAATPVEVQAAAAAPVLDPALAKAVVLIMAEVSLLTAVALLFSTFTSSGILAAALTLGVFVVGVFSEDLRGFTAISDAPVLVSIVRGVGMVVPAFSAFDVKADIVNGRLPVPWAYVAMTVAYAISYATALVGAAMALFARREFT